MKDFLKDLVSHTHSLGVIPIIRVTANNGEVRVDSLAEDHSVILNAKTHQPVANLDGVFGMPNLNKLDLHLKCPEYKENASIDLMYDVSSEQQIPSGLLFKNSVGDYTNEYRFMSRKIVDQKLDEFECPDVRWDIEFQPAQTSIQRFKYQIGTHLEDPSFSISLQSSDIVFKFGSIVSHAGSFVFQSNVSGKLRSTLIFPKNIVLSVLNLSGDKTIKLSDSGAMLISVDSGIAVYDYIFPAELD
jgi:hypothetical protein